MSRAMPGTVGLVLVAVLSGCGQHASRFDTWRSCPRPPSGADIRRFSVRGGETCRHARRVLDGAAFGHEGSCGDSCRSLGYVCQEHPGGLEPDADGVRYYTYEDDTCVRGSREATWRIVVHQP